MVFRKRALATMSINAYQMPTGVQIPPATDFRQNQTASSRYRFRRVLGEGSQAQAPFAMAVSSTTDVNFRFGAGYVINLAKTRLRICEKITNTAVGTATVTRAVPPIAAIRLQTSSGVILLDIQNCDAFMHAVYPLIEKYKDATKQARGVNPIMKNPIAAAPTEFAGVTIGNLDATTYPSGTNLVIAQPVLGTGTGGTGVPVDNGIASTVNGMIPGGPIIVPGRQEYYAFTASADTGPTINPAGSGNAYFNTNYTTGASWNPSISGYELPRQYIVAPQGLAITNATGQSAGVLYTQWDVPLASLLPHTVCAALQDLYFGTDLLMTVSFAAQGRRAFQATLDDMAQADYNPRVAVIANGAAVTASSCYYSTDLLLATQDNLDLVNSVKQEIAGKGIRIPVQQPFVSIESLTPSTTADLIFSRVIRLNIARGAALLKSYIGICSSVTPASTVAGVTRCFNNMVMSTSATAQRFSQWNRYRMFLNAVPMSDSSLDPRDQYKRSYDWLKDSYAREFEAWLFLGGISVEDFTSGFDLSKTTPEGGLPLANPIDVQCDMTISQHVAAPATTEHVFIGVMLKYLSISPAGVTLESV